MTTDKPMYGDKLKYIIFDNRYPVIFSPLINHCDMRAAGVGQPTSAGFVVLVPIKRDGQPYINATCCGESISLNLKNNGDHDDAIIERAVNPNFEY